MIHVWIFGVGSVYTYCNSFVISLKYELKNNEMNKPNFKSDWKCGLTGGDEEEEVVERVKQQTQQQMSLFASFYAPYEMYAYSSSR